MTRNQKIGINMFFKQLKKLGAFNEYVTNYMLFHRIPSPLKIPNKMVEEYSMTITGREEMRYMVNKNSSPSEWNVFYAKHFGSFAFSFDWINTPEGGQKWGHINFKLRRINNIEE